MKRPNVDRMRRAMVRGERDRLLRDRRFSAPMDIDPDVARRMGDAWVERVHRHFPSAEIITWRDLGADRIIAEWRS